jgi:DNA-binding transcriptional ArsR family regulator
MPRLSPPFYIADARKIATIASPVRAAVIDALEVLGPATVVQLARALGYPPDGLYYHVGVLERHGLVVRMEPVKESGAARFDLPGHPATLRYRLDDRRQRDAIAQVVATMLRSAQRGFRRSFAPGHATVQGPQRNLRAGRRTAWLTARELRVLNRYIERIHALFGRGVPRRAGARLHEFTYVLAPIREKRLRSSPRSRKSGARS